MRAVTGTLSESVQRTRVERSTREERDMDQQEWLAARFEDNRPHLRAVAYRMLGSLSEADDAVQDAWLRLSRSDTSEVENLRAWLTTVVARVALNVLRSRRTRREEPLDVRMPDQDGPAILHALRQINPAVRCCFMTGDSGDYSQAELLATGALDVLPKPFHSLEEIARRLGQIACADS